MNKNCALTIFAGICAAHVGEHAAQAFQVYALRYPPHAARGVLGQFWPWLVHSETLHFGYAVLMLAGLYWLRDLFSGAAGTWWRVALGIQAWHYVEHFILLAQATIGHNLFGAPQPISLIQLTGFFNGPAETGFNGLLKWGATGTLCDCAGVKPGTLHYWTPLLLTVRRIEVHLIYNAIVVAPMIVAMVKARALPAAQPYRTP